MTELLIAQKNLIRLLCTICNGQLYSIKQHEKVQQEKANILLKMLRDIVAVGTKENSAIFGKANLNNVPKEIVSKFRVKV